jgi:hypothetical protein
MVFGDAVSHTAAANRPGMQNRKWGIGRFPWMTIDPMTGVIAVSLVVALLFYLWPPPPDDHAGPGETAP